MRTQTIEIEEIKRAKPPKAEDSYQNHNLNNEEMGEKQEEEKKLEENKLKWVEKEKRELANSITELTKQINELKTEMSTKHEEATAMSGQNSKKITDLKHENDKLRNNVHQLQAEKEK